MKFRNKVHIFSHFRTYNQNTQRVPSIHSRILLIDRERIVLFASNHSPIVTSLELSIVDRVYFSRGLKASIGSHPKLA